MDHHTAQTWLDRYVAAWKSYDPDAIAALFAPLVEYRYHPYDEAIVGVDSRDPTLELERTEFVRVGTQHGLLRRIVEAAPKRIVYVSCNPTTLAPNAAQLVEAGYVLERVRPVDLFPQTPHIESVALLTAGPDGVRNPERE